MLSVARTIGLPPLGVPPEQPRLRGVSPRPRFPFRNPPYRRVRGMIRDRTLNVSADAGRNLREDEDSTGAQVEMTGIDIE